jgi:hypothetical protein
VGRCPIFISYGGVVFQYNATNSIEYKAVYDNALDYIYTEINVDIHSYFNPLAMSYFNDAPTGFTPFPVQNYGNLPSNTILAIQNILTQPRNQLIVQDDASNSFIISPSDGLPFDVKGGPFPELIRIEKVAGQTTWEITWRCRTFINECLLNGPILSNRWNTQWETNENMRATVHYNGKAQLALNALYYNDWDRSQFVQSLLPFVLPYFKRTQISVTYEDDGAGVSYSCTDEEQKYYSLGTLDWPGSPAQIYKVTSFKASICFQTLSVSTGQSEIPQINNPALASITVAGEVFGSQDASKGGLTMFAMQLVDEKLGSAGVGVLGNNYAGHISSRIEQQFDEPAINFSVTVVAYPDTQVQAFTGTFNQQLLFRDPYIVFLLPYDGFHPQLSWGGSSQLNDPNVSPTFCGILAACMEPCNLGIPAHSALVNECGGPISDAYYYRTVTQRVFNPPVNTDTYNNNYSTSIGGGLNPVPGIMYYTLTKLTETVYNIIQGATTGPPPQDSGSSSQSKIPSWTTQSQSSRSASEVMSLSAPVSKLIVDWEGAALNDYPPIPAIITDNTNLIPVKSKVMNYATQLTTGGDPIYRVDGRYEFVNSTYVQSGDALNTSIMPFVGLAFNDEYMNASLFMGGLIDGNTAPQYNIPGGNPQN